MVGSSETKLPPCSYVSPDKKTLSLEFDGARQHSYHAVWLRHTCKCDKCWNSSSNQSTASPLHALPTSTIKDAKVEGDALVVSWTEEDDPDHVGFHLLTWLKENAYDMGTRTLKHTSARPTPLKGKMKHFQFSDVMSSDWKRLEWLMALYDDGLTMVQNVPLETGRVREVAQRIGNVQKTFYGETFDVVSTENPINVAYTASKLFLHQDLQYYESPPGIQLLHCLKFDSCIEGGESAIVDMFHFAEQFRIQHPEEFNVLCRVNASFYKVNLTTHLHTVVTAGQSLLQTMTVVKSRPCTGIRTPTAHCVLILSGSSLSLMHAGSLLTCWIPFPTSTSFVSLQETSLCSTIEGCLMQGTPSLSMEGRGICKDAM